MSNAKTENSLFNRLSRLIETAGIEQKLKKVIFSKPKKQTYKKVILTLKAEQKRSYWQMEYFHLDNKVTHQNMPCDSSFFSCLSSFCGNFEQINVLCSMGECEYKCTAGGKEVILGIDKLERKLAASEGVAIPVYANNREKQYILNGSEPFLKLLGVSDRNGRIYDRKQSKFRQINRFLELIRDIEDKLPNQELQICDLCCGKSYLSFAVYHYFANIKHYHVSMTGVDLKPDVIEHCTQIANELHFNGLTFLCEDIQNYVPATSPSLVISLHACDIATDLVLKRAVEWKTDVILSTPCCHHELNHVIQCPALSFITDYSMLRQKFCDAATDALRLCWLESEGYSTAALELIDPEETPKNIMLRAVRQKNFNFHSKQALEKKQRYLDAKTFLCTDLQTPVHF